MATATRIAQPAKTEITYEPHAYREFRVITDNGEEIGRTQQGEVLYSYAAKGRKVSQPNRITLDLSLDEAITLAIIARQTGGSPDGRRGDMDNILRALRAIGIDIDRAGMNYHPDLPKGIHFGGGRNSAYVRSSLDDASSPNAGTGCIEHKTQATSGCGSSARYPSTTYKEPLAR